MKMIGDVLLITDQHKKAGKQVLAILGDISHLKKYTIAIGGESGSGKSELSHVIAKLLKIRNVYAKVIHTDNYYIIPPKNRSTWRKNSNFINVGLNEIDWPSLHTTIEQFKKGDESIIPFIDLYTDQVDKLITNFEEIDVLILDGLYSLNLEVNLKIIIDLTYKETKLAQLIRGKEKMDEERLIVLQKEHEAVQSLQNRADFLITKNFDVIENK